MSTKFLTLVSIIIIAIFLISSAKPTELNKFPILPDPAMTPGMVDPKGVIKKICVTGYTTTVRNVPDSVRKQVFAEYNIDPKANKFEIDHLISLEIGGTNDIKNLWPQSYETLPWNAHIKDKLENRLHKMVCNNKITLEDAQTMISKDWISAYCKYYADKPSDCNNYLKRP